MFWSTAHVTKRSSTSRRRSLIWHSSVLTTRFVHRRAFGSLGEGTVIVRPYSLLGTDRIHIGSRCSIYDNTWLAVEFEGGPLHIGDDVSFGPGCHVHAMDPIRIGDRCMFAEGVYVGSADHDKANRHLVTRSGAVSIGNDVFLGLRSVVLGGVTIGDGATIGAHSVVTRDVAAGSVVAGNPARAIR